MFLLTLPECIYIHSWAEEHASNTLAKIITMKKNFSASTTSCLAKLEKRETEQASCQLLQFNADVWSQEPQQAVTWPSIEWREESLSHVYIGAGKAVLHVGKIMSKWSLLFQTHFS